MRNLLTSHMDTYSQRNNQLSPLESCNVTAACQALHICGHKFPQGPYSQEEDSLLYFIRHDGDVQSYYKSTGFAQYYNPEEIHTVLIYAINKWIGKNVADTSASLSYDNIKGNIDAGNCVLLSGYFPTYKGININHIITCHGYYDDGLIISDSYGNYHDLYAGTRCTRNIQMPTKDFLEYIKPVQEKVKCGMVVYAHS